MTITDVGLSFDEWVIFVFDHPVTESSWYSDEKWNEFWWEKWHTIVGPKQQLSYVTKLFEDSAILLNGYTPMQIDDGLGMILSGPAEFAIDRLIWNKKLPWLLREKCIDSMVTLFRTLFAKIDVEFSCWMWWDILREWEHNERRDPKTKGAIFQALVSILEIPSRNCQMSALHGLNHIQHTGKERLIYKYIESNPNLDEDVKEYAIWAIEGGMV